MNKPFFMSMNLQKFAESETQEETVIDEPMEEEPVIEESAVDEPTEEIDEEELTEETVIEPPKQNNSVPIAKYLSEKKKRQELEKVLSQQAAERERLNVTQGYLERGYPETEAVLLAKKDVETKADLERLSAKVFDREVQGDIRDLAKSNDFYADAETFAEEIKDTLKENPKLNVKQAYMLLRGESRTYEMRQKQEQLSAVKRKQVVSKKVTTASPSAPSNPYKLDEHDKKALAELKKMQPDAGWSSEKYFKAMKN